ncbi:hypothetical protein BDW75DRAFT_245837 [Aspergillus navahoensis]
MAACCAVSAFVIYQLISIHSRLFTSSNGRPEISTATDNPTLPVEHILQPIQQKTDRLRTSRLSLRGLYCQSCAAAIENSIRSLPGVENASVSLHSLSASVSYHPQHANPDQFVTAIKCKGFEAVLQANPKDWRSQWVTAASLKQEAIDKQKKSFQAAGIVSGLIFTVEAMQSWNNHNRLSLMSVLGALKLVTAVTSVALLAAPIHREAYSALAHGRITTSLLSSAGLISVLAAALHNNIIQTAHGSQTKSPGFSITSACMLMTVLIGGGLTKDIVFQQSSRFPAMLASAIPDTAQLLSDPSDSNSKYNRVSTDLLHPGDKIVVNPRDQFPADCVITTGHTSVVETIMKGETSPTTVGPGDVVLAGCTNCDGRIIAEVVRFGIDTRLGETLRAVAEASETSSRLQHSSDRLLASFAMLVFAFALSLGIVHLRRGASLEELLNRMATVLLCACPCTLGLGIPICHITATSNAHKSQIILRSGPRFENAARARVLVFDKTGTLTYGELHVQEVDIEPEWGAYAAQRAVFWQMIGDLTRNLKHPVSVLLNQLSLKFSVARDLTELEPAVLLSHEAQPGLGLMAVFTFHDRTFDLAVGNIRMMQMQNVYAKSMFSPNIASDTAPLSSVFVAINGRLAGTVSFTDRIVAEAASHIQELHSRGFQTYMMTGDTKSSAQVVATQVGIPSEHVYASLLPHDKSRLIAQLERQHGPVIMVGDNLNDAAALAASNFGIVLSHQTEQNSVVEGAINSMLLASLQAEADALLLPTGKDVNKDAITPGDSPVQPAKASNFHRIIYILDLAKETNKRMRQVLQWSLAYNIVALVLASDIPKALIPCPLGEWVAFSP